MRVVKLDSNRKSSDHIESIFPRFVGVRASRGCTGDEGRPLEVGMQVQASNRLKLHGLRTLLVSVEGKDIAMSGKVRGDERKRKD